MISFLRGAAYVGSYARIDDCAPEMRERPLVAFTGRSNAGKSSLISALCDHQNLAKVSRTAGKTRTLNFFSVREAGLDFFLVDLPGFGYANASQSERERMRKLIDEFLINAENVVLYVQVIDARRDLSREEYNIVRFCSETERELLLARTKWDKLNSKERQAARRDWRRAELDEISVPVSAPKRVGLDLVLGRMRAALGDRTITPEDRQNRNGAESNKP